MLPMPSTVVTAAPCIEQSGARQALTAVCRTVSERPWKRETVTVQAPQPPSPQPNLEPVRQTGLRIRNRNYTRGQGISGAGGAQKSHVCVL